MSDTYIFVFWGTQKLLAAKMRSIAELRAEKAATQATKEEFKKIKSCGDKYMKDWTEAKKASKATEK